MATLSVNTIISVSTQEPGEYSKTGFEAVTFTPIAEVSVIDEFGSVATISEFIDMKTGISKLQKGSIDYGTMEMLMGRVTDTGQSLLVSGMDGANFASNFSFRLTTPMEGYVEGSAPPPPPPTLPLINVTTVPAQLTVTGQAATIAGGITPTPIQITNYATNALLANMLPSGATTTSADTTIVGPFGTNVVVANVNFVDLNKYLNAAAGAVATFTNATAVRMSIWVRNPSPTAYYRLTITGSTSTPTTTASRNIVLAYGLWQRIYIDVVGTYTAATTLEFSLGRVAVGTSSLQVWKDSLLIEDRSTSWTGLHETHLVSAQLATGAKTSYFTPMPEILWFGDSISNGCCDGVTDGYFPLYEMICQTLELTYDTQGLQSVGGAKSDTIAGRAKNISLDAWQFTVEPPYSARPTVLDRPTIIWIGTNDNGSYMTPEWTINNIKTTISYLTARGNQRYLIATVMQRADSFYAGATWPPSGGVYLRIEALNALLRTDPITKDHLIDIHAILGYPFTIVGAGPAYTDLTDRYDSGDLHFAQKGYTEYGYPAFLNAIIATGWFNR